MAFSRLVIAMTEVEGTKLGLGVRGRVDGIDRLNCDPPAEWDMTIWGVEHHGDQKILIEVAQINCPECQGTAYWRKGVMECEDCETKQRLIG